jgi:hypothetical protein
MIVPFGRILYPDGEYVIVFAFVVSYDNLRTFSSVKIAYAEIS